MTATLDDDLDREEKIPLPELEPKYFHAQACSSLGYVFDEYDCVPIFSYGKSSVEQRRALFDESAPDSDDQIDYSTLEPNHVYEAWIGRGDLIGMCHVTLTTIKYTEAIHFAFDLETIFIAPRHRKQGVAAVLCKTAARKEFDRIANFIMSLPDHRGTQYKFIVDSDVRNEGGIKMAQTFFDELSEMFFYLGQSQGFKVECEEAFNDWVSPLQSKTETFS
ncbi:MAG: hypothetical protein WAW05_05070 [Corynebacterium casei]